MKAELIHEKSEEYKTLCILAEDVMNLTDGSKVFENWYKLACLHEKRTNFKGVLYRSGTDYVICYIGTDLRSIKDHIANLLAGFWGINLQMRIANYFYKNCKERFDFYNKNLTLIGHSEGGTEATYVGIKNNIKVVTFNTFGLSRKQYDANRDYSELVINYRDESDIVSKIRENPGTTYVVPNSFKQCTLKRVLGSVKSHRITNMCKLSEAILLEEYCKTHPFFIEKYKILK